jgi:hypothetical protein
VRLDQLTCSLSSLSISPWNIRRDSCLHHSNYLLHSGSIISLLLQFPSGSGLEYDSSVPPGLDWTHFDIGPCITQGYSPAFFIDIRKSIIDMSEMLEWDLLRWEFTSINTPVDQLPFIIRRSSPSAYQLTYQSVSSREGDERHTKYPTVLLLLISSSVVLGKCCLNLWTTVVWLRIQLRPKNRIRPVKMVDLLILCGFGLVSFGGEDMQCSRIRSEAVQVPE